MSDIKANKQHEVLALTYYYPPDNTSGVFRSLYFFNHITARGRWRVNILTLDPDCYLPEQSRDQALLMRIHPDIRVTRAKAVHPRNRLITLKRNLFRCHGHATKVQGTVNTQNKTTGNIDFWSKFKDVVTDELLAFPDAQVGWLPSAYAAACRLISNNGAIKVIYSSASPWSSHLLAFLLHKKFGLPMVLDYRDPWHGNPYNVMHCTTIYRKASFALERKIIKAAQYIVCNTHRLKAFYAEVFGDSDKFITITNGYEEVANGGGAAGSSEDGLVVVHAGALYGGRNPESFMQAVANMRGGGQDIRVLLVGAGMAMRDSIAGRFGKEFLEQAVLITPRLAHFECMKLLESADVLLLFQQGTALQVPRKLYEYIGLNKPILAICDGGEVEDIIQKGAFGISVRDKTEQIENALQALKKGKKQPRPNTGNHMQYDNKVLAAELESLFDRVMDKKE